MFYQMFYHEIIFKIMHPSEFFGSSSKLGVYDNEIIVM